MLRFDKEIKITYRFDRASSMLGEYLEKTDYNRDIIHKE